MKNKRVNALQIWKQFEDVVAPRLRLSAIERAVYSHLLRHSRLEGKLRLRFSIPGLGRGIQLSANTARKAMRRLIDQGALRLVDRSKTGHVVEVRLPEEIRGARLDAAGVRSDGIGVGLARQTSDPAGRAASLEEIDFMQTKALRQAIHLRERGNCFYCLRRLTPTVRCLDHVVPRVQLGRNGYRNLVSCCLECNSRKGEKRAEDFLRWLYRERRLTAVELMGRLRALDVLAAGKLPPPGTRNLGENPTRGSGLV